MLNLKSKGFTLLEVMLAVTILSVGLIFVLRSYLTSLRAIKVTQNLFIANLLLEQKVWQKQEQQMREGNINTVEDVGEFESPFSSFNYQLSFEEDPDLPLLYKGIFKISWQQRNRIYDTSCVTYMRSK